MIVISIILIVCGILLIILTAMGIQCYNQKGGEAFKKSKGTNFTFMILFLVGGILMTIVGIGLIAFKVFLTVHPAGRIMSATMPLPM